MSTYRTIDAKAELLGGIVDAAAELNDRIIDASGELVTEIRATTYPDYTGEYNVTPTEEEQQLNTAETVLLENVTVDAIPADYVGSGVARQSELAVSGLTVTAGAGYYEEAVSETVTPNLQSASESYTPTESAQTDTITYDQDHDGLSSVEIAVGAIPADYVGSEVPRRDSLSVSGATVSGAAGYYDEAVSATVDAGSATTPDTSITANPSISVGSDGLISASVSKTQSVTPTVQEGYVTTGTAGNVTVSGSNTSQLPTQAGTTITPSTSVQTAVPAGKFTTGDVKVAAMTNATWKAGSILQPTPSISVDENGLITASVYESTSVQPLSASGYAEKTKWYSVIVNESNTSQLSTQAGTTITPTTSEQTAVAAGKYTTGAVKVAAMPSGTAGTPTASKGAVSGHAVTVTPSVTNTTGYITGGTHTGTGVTVSASELVSGSETKTANGTYDVTNLAELIVNVAGGGGGLTYETGTYTPTADTARPTITWTNTHTEAPVLVLFSDQTGTAHSTTNSNYNFMYCDFYKLWGYGIPYSSSGFRYAVAYYSYRGNSTSSISSSATVITNNSDSTSSSGTTYPRYWASPTDFHPYSGSTSRYWRSGRTYKWIAVWKPTS